MFEPKINYQNFINIIVFTDTILYTLMHTNDTIISEHLINDSLTLEILNNKNIVDYVMCFKKNENFLKQNLLGGYSFQIIQQKLLPSMQLFLRP